MNLKINDRYYRQRLTQVSPYLEAGKITKALGLIFEANLPGASMGSLCRILVDPDQPNSSYFDAEVIGFKENRVTLMPYEEVQGVNNESIVLLEQSRSTVRVGGELLGRVVDGLGRPIDHGGDIGEASDGSQERELYQKPLSPMGREVISEPLSLGIRSIDGLLTSGKGQRMGIMAGSGVGKSVLLGMMARNTNADVNVIALIGERGREVREFIERDLGEEGLKRSVVIVATSDTSPLLRMRAAFFAMAVAEYFRDQNKDVLLLMDSLTRFCMAQRQIGLSMGEPPTSRGYTPSVFSLLPKLIERAGRGGENHGSITGLYTVLVEGDDMDEPIADAARSYLDGHIVLSRKLAQRNHFPAVDVLQSTSRVMAAVATPPHRDMASKLREWMATYQQVEDLINLGAYVKGANPRIDQAISVQERIEQFLRQPVEDQTSLTESLSLMQGIVRAGEAFLAGSKSDVRA